MDYFNKELMKNEFDIVNSTYIWEMILIVAVSSSHRHAVGNIKNYHKAHGFGNIIGNKAGLGCTFSVYDIVFTVFNVHLHAGQKNVEKRMDMMNSLIGDHKLGDEEIDATELSDYAFLIGDFNFRMNTTFTAIIDNVDKIHDQVNLDEFYTLKSTTQSFSGFTEGEKKFMPTYKRQHKSNGYTNKKEQPPSWTDRVLIKNNCGRKVNIKEYDCMDDFWGSDHRPVFGEFEIPLDHPDFYQIIRGQFTQEALQNQLISVIKVSKITVNFLINPFTAKDEVPCSVRWKFLGDMISTETGAFTEAQTLFLLEEFDDSIVFEKSEWPEFTWVPNVVEWIKQLRIIVKVEVKFKNTEFWAYASVLLNRIYEKGLCVLFSNVDLVSKNTRVGQISLEMNYWDIDHEAQQVPFRMETDVDEASLPQEQVEMSNGEEEKSE